MSEKKGYGIGTPVGLCDSNGDELRVGDKVKMPVDCNNEMHGNWSIYTVKLQGMVPILSYFKSEKGQVLPEGYTACCLSDRYDQKMFVFAKDSNDLRPNENIFKVND